MVPAVYRLLALRYVLHRWDRAALIVASIALGVATLVSARILNQCIEAAAQDTTTPGGAADLYVTNGEAGVLTSLAEEVRARNIPGVKAVQPMVYERISLPQLDDDVAVLLGANLNSGLADPGNPLKATIAWKTEAVKAQLGRAGGALARGGFTAFGASWEKIPGRFVVVSKSIYDGWKGRVGAEHPLVLRYAGRDVTCLPVGYIEFEKESPLYPLRDHFVGMEVGQAARVLRPAPTDEAAAVVGGPGVIAWTLRYPPKVNRLDLYLEPDAARTDEQKEGIRQAVADLVGNRAEVRTPDTQRRSTQEIVSGLQIGFLVCSAGAMIVGLFLVYNALAVTVAERRTDIGILRSLGATRGQVITLFASAAAILGLVGAALGVPLGIVLAEVTLGQFKAELQSMFINPNVTPSRIGWSTAGLAMLAGVATTVFAALVPAIQAAADDPAHVVRRSAAGAKGVWRLIHRLACVALIAGGAGMIVLRHDLPPRVGGVGGMMTVLVGLLLSAPLVVGVMVSGLRPFVRLCPISVRLAFDNLSRAPARTGVVIGALGAGVAMIFQTAGVGRSNQEPIVSWISQVVQADHFVFSGNMTTANASNSPIAAKVVDDLRALPTVEYVMSIRYARPEFNGTVVYLIALDADVYARATRSRVPTGLPDVDRFRELPKADTPGPNAVFVSKNFARRHGVDVGDTIEVPGSNGPVRLLITGTVNDYSWSRGSIFMDRSRYARLFGDELVDICHVFLKPGAEVGGSGSRPVEKYAADHNLMVTDRDSLRRFLSELLDRIYLLAYLQQIIVGVVAALGVITALLISVLQRKREIGLLLAVGATPGQVLRSVLAEALLMGVFGTVLGILIGIPMEWYVVRVVLVDESGFLLDVLMPWKQTLGIAAIAVGTATLAGLFPAIRAVHTRIPDAIQWE